MNWKHLLRAALIGAATAVLGIDIDIRGCVFIALITLAFILTDLIAEEDAKKRVNGLVRRLTSRRAA